VGDDTVSVVLPVHVGVSPDHLAAALRSIEDQSLAPFEVVVVEDGPLDSTHHDVLDRFERAVDAVTRVVLDVNQGAGVANQAGLLAARGTWIAKADADDVSMTHRLSTLLDAARVARADVCGAAMLEFDDDPSRPTGLRTMPLTHRDIARRMRWNNPVNHPTVIYRRDLATSVGGYPPWRFMQDYGLFARMLAGGARFRNLDEPLVWFRTGPDVVARRRRPELVGLEWRLQQLLEENDIVGRRDKYARLAVRVAYRRMPARVVSFAQSRVLARRAVGEEAS
jgi:glycosyltransferase involved in cell wall biosynthesis